MSLADNSINTLTGPLYLQSLGLGGIDILAGKIMIDQEGNLTIEGDATIKGSLFANIIQPLDEQDLVIDLAHSEEATGSGFGDLLVKGLDGEIVASIDASGAAQFASLDITRRGVGLRRPGPSGFDCSGGFKNDRMENNLERHFLGCLVYVLRRTDAWRAS